MKLNRITNEDPINRMYISFHQSFLEKMDAYLELYKKTYGDELPRAQFIEEVVGRFMDSDKDFTKYLKEKDNSSY